MRERRLKTTGISPTRSTSIPVVGGENIRWQRGGRERVIVEDEVVVVTQQ
jgi:hypothetical protein